MGFYDVLFGAADRLFGAYALLRYPNPSLLRHQRVYLVLLTGWMLAGRTLIVVTALPQWAGAPASSWWLTLIPNMHLNDVVNYVVNAGEGLFGVALLVLLAMRLVRTTGLDRIVITPIIVAGLAAVIAAAASAVTQMLSALNGTPNGVYTVESAVDLAIPLAFLVAAMQRTLLLRNITALTAQISGGADIGAVRYALRSTLHDPTLEVLDLPPPPPDRRRRAGASRAPSRLGPCWRSNQTAVWSSSSAPKRAPPSRSSSPIPPWRDTGGCSTPPSRRADWR